MSEIKIDEFSDSQIDAWTYLKIKQKNNAHLFSTIWRDGYAKFFWHQLDSIPQIESLVLPYWKVAAINGKSPDKEFFTRLYRSIFNVNTYTKKAEVCNKTEVYGKVKQDVSGGGGTDRYPRSVQVFASDKQKTKLDGTIHPTQKPLALLEMLVKSYTNEGDMVLDNTTGSGTTNLACIKLNRKSIGIEKEKQYYDVAVRRASEYYH